jgi:hypothetical protein
VKKRILDLNKVRLDGDTQPRAGINTALVSEYAKLYEKGVELPPVVVFFDGVDYWLADGFHRWHARNKTEIEGLSCEIHNGTVEDARWWSYAANQTHGQRRTNADKQKAAKAALLHPKGAGLSDRQIAEYVGVSHSTVAKFRAELEQEGSLANLASRTGRDGRTTDTTNIGGGAAEEEPEETQEEEATEPKPKAAKGAKELESFVRKWIAKHKHPVCVAAAMLENLAAKLSLT